MFFRSLLHLSKIAQSYRCFHEKKLILLNLTLVVAVPSSTCNKGKQIRRRLWDYGLKEVEKRRKEREREKKSINQTRDLKMQLLLQIFLFRNSFMELEGR